MINLCPGSTVTLMSGEQTAALMEHCDSRSRVGLAWRLEEVAGGGGCVSVVFATVFDPFTSFNHNCISRDICACQKVSSYRRMSQCGASPQITQGQKV